ncbi:hypothetical protein [Methanococcoides sp. AM1]|uniref:hypothetical protein n=1 Tax=Methanococcoides sp. AM1 TaxID=1201011 RepID=UPI0010846181|nr:hypothetical protein [Methanococcoides sp. AM1]
MRYGIIDGLIEYYKVEIILSILTMFIYGLKFITWVLQLIPESHQTSVFLILCIIIPLIVAVFWWAVIEIIGNLPAFGRGFSRR